MHVSWFLVLLIEFDWLKGYYSSPVWNLVECLALFSIVLMHEFGHSLACKQTGGKADRIMLWPFGGVAFVQPPQRPGAVLWSIAAGPLVNVALVPVTIWIYRTGYAMGWYVETPNLAKFLSHLVSINIGLLVFNMMPVYPLDGGQILRALLWFVIGRASSLRVATVIGVLGVAGFGVLAFYQQSVWLGLMAFMGLQQCINGFKQAGAISRIEKMPRHAGFKCPNCGEAPLQGDYWVCECGARFDMFATGAVCPQCHKQHERATCPFCTQSGEFHRWVSTP